MLKVLRDGWACGAADDGITAVDLGRKMDSGIRDALEARIISGELLSGVACIDFDFGAAIMSL